MTESRHVCDRCGAVILEGRTLLQVETGALRSLFPAVDLCPDCGQLLAGWLTAERRSAPVLAASATERP